MVRRCTLWTAVDQALLEREPEAVPALDAWSRADVEMWLKVCFRAMRDGAPIFAPRAQTNTLISASKVVPSATFDIAAFAATVLGRRSPECRAVLIWARTVASPYPGDCSIQQFCNEVGWNRRTFDRARVRACDRIAVAKNAADRAGRTEKSSSSL